ncbi:hypothetical protein RN001_005632 [Aquatica leii]|uniref:Uncharacterized protein n=1 Tax=Aquatica leii TaxID=1421715 RepID=A0AAN7SPX1_9COLE|nr:hypothetical protein RN001_005632 [Aquatica leii]
MMLLYLRILENLVDEQSFQLLTKESNLSFTTSTCSTVSVSEISEADDTDIDITDSSVEIDITDNIDARLLFNRPSSDNCPSLNDVDLLTNNDNSPNREILQLFPEGLESLLKKSQDGQIVLLKKNVLDNDCRQKLVRIVIDFSLSPQNQYFTNKRINHDLL